MKIIKILVLIISLLIIFSSKVYAPEISWPDNVPLGESFHNTTYTDVIDDASGDDLIEIRANLDFDWNWNISNVVIDGSEIYGDTTYEGDLLIEGDINATGNLGVDGNANIEGNLAVTNVYNEDEIWSPEYCNVEGDLCYSIDQITNVLDLCINCYYPTLFEVLSDGGGVPDGGGNRDSSNASDFTGITKVGGKIEAPNFAAILSVSGDVNYYLENIGGLSRIVQDGTGFMYIQSASNKIKIEGLDTNPASWGGMTAEKIELNADTTNALGNLTVGGNVAIGIDSSDGYRLYVNGQTYFSDDIVGTEGFLMDNDVTNVYDGGASDSPYSRVNADSFHTNDLGVGQIYIEGRAIDADTVIAIGNGLASDMSAVDVKIGDNNEIFVDTSANSVGIGTNAPGAKLSIIGGVHVGGNTDPGDGNLAVDGDITVVGTVDGKDIADNAAMLNEAETITGNWVNTANPWADNEVSDILTINSSGSVDKGAIARVTAGTLGFDWTDAEVAADLTISSSGSVDSTALIDGGTISFDWINDEVADDLTISSSGTVDKGALSSSGTLGFDWADGEIADDLTISSSGSVDSTALIDGGTISFDWVDDEVSDTLTASEITCTGCVAEGEIAQDTLDDTEIEDNILTADSLATNSVGNDELVDTITLTELTVNSITPPSGNVVIKLASS